MTAPISFAPGQPAYPQAPAQQPQAPMTQDASANLPKEAISALYKDTLATFVEYKMKEAAYQQLTGQSPTAALGQVGNNPFETPQIGNEPQAIGPGPADMQPQPPSFMPGQTPPPQIPGMAPQV
jgi:hypothetical protein